MAPSPDFPFPVELLTEIVKFLSTQDQRTLSLASWVTRIYTIPFTFGNLQYTGEVARKVQEIHQASQRVKDVIRKVVLKSKFGGVNNDAVIFEFLKSLPNLKSFEFTQSSPLIPPAHIPQLITSLQQAPLTELILSTGYYNTINGPPTLGLSGLKKLAISWYLNDNPEEAGSSLAYFYGLIQPSLSTLVELTLNYDPHDEYLGGDFDLKFLKPAGETLRVFEYTLQPDESVLEVIPDIFPHLTKLSIKWENIPSGQSVLWKDSHTSSLAKNVNLIELTLSSDFEITAEDTVTADGDYAWYIRSYKRRLKATQDVAAACRSIQKVNWTQLQIGHHAYSSMVHPFIVEVQRVPSGEVKRVVRGVKQRWMGGDRMFWYNKEIVNCKLEDLPGDIIGENGLEDSVE